ncbi:hypothetical protein [Yoonia sediminilitoris]|uniref:Uncharacterized protein n=1 Tax=Yoonia sediminilitoris TaxID=1286148 RepID=A0A2T6KB40_9RHOB|nr:hypothetical protein [Yoonia sediminilitoris]PUB12086.1 hypothetical protein C8N45_11163 [Yoonia sediminilitoris]RCW92913.1 hypothetical protein DFP92_11162 [Yoonia sediminilitoris]
MKRLILSSAILCAACEGGSGGLGGPSGDGGMREFMVIGSSMGFERCRSLGGLIIRDSNTNMVACDPQVRGEPVPADEFNHPDINPAKA